VKSGVDDCANMDVTMLLLVLFASVFLLYIGAVAFGVFSSAVIPQDVYGNKTVYTGGVSMGSNELNSSLNAVDSAAATVFSLAGLVPLILVGLMFLAIVGFKIFR
jgi:hypothetical protein